MHFNPLPTALGPVSIVLTTTLLISGSVEALINIERRAVARAHRMRQFLPILESSAKHRP